MKMRKGERYVFVFLAMLGDREIGSSEIRVYLYLCSMNNEKEGGAFPTEESISRSGLINTSRE